MKERSVPDSDSLRAARRHLKKLDKALARATEEAALPRARLSGDQLQMIARRAMAGEGYAMIAKELGYNGDLHSALDETFRAAGRPGTRHAWGGAEAMQRWVLSYGDAETAYRWHLTVANDRAQP